MRDKYSVTVADHGADGGANAEELVSWLTPLASSGPQPGSTDCGASASFRRRCAEMLRSSSEHQGRQLPKVTAAPGSYSSHSSYRFEAAGH
jgi:hypothetical protein